MWELSVPPFQSCCKPKTAQKIVLIYKQRYVEEDLNYLDGSFFACYRPRKNI